MNTCKKCNGLGHLAEYAHVSNGRCFACDGTGKVQRKRSLHLQKREIEEYRGKFPLDSLCQDLSEEKDFWLVACSLPWEALPSGQFEQDFSCRTSVRYVVGFVCGNGSIVPTRISGIHLRTSDEVRVTQWN